MTLGELYAQHFEPQRRMAVALTRGQGGPGGIGDAWADDLVQETFLRAMAHLDALSAMTEAHRGNWLRLTLKRLWIDHTRRQRRIAPEEAMIGGDQGRRDDLTVVEVQQALSYLPGDLAQIVSLRYLAGFDSTRIGEMLSMPPATVRTKLRGAVSTLKRLYREGKV